MTKRDFYDFFRKLRETFEIVFKMLKDAFKRDTFIVNNLYTTQIHPSGRGLYTRTETHNDLKMFKVDVIRKGFRRPKEIPVFNDPNISTYRGGSDDDDSPDRTTNFGTTNIKTTGGFRKKRSTAPDSQVDSLTTNPQRSMSGRNN